MLGFLIRMSQATRLLAIWRSGVEFAEEDGLLRGYSQPNDPDLPQQWAMYRLGLFTDGLAGGASDRGAWNRWAGPACLFLRAALSGHSCMVHRRCSSQMC